MLISRSIYPKLIAHLAAKEITLLVGPRQAGKTYLMRLLQRHLDSQGEKTMFLSLDNEDDRQHFVSQRKLLDKINLHVGSMARGYIFIDEIQRKEDAGVFLKGIYDMELPYKLIVSGSGSLELKERIHESLAGRKQVFEVDTLSFEEFVHVKTKNQFVNKLPEFFRIESIRAGQMMEEYMIYGGYPRVVLSETLDEKRMVMGEIYQSYLERDMRDLLHIEKTEALTHLVKILSSQIGGLVNVSEVASTIGVAQKTVSKYLWYLEKTFILKKITPYFRNVRSEISKSSLYYFYDMGLRNYILGLFGIPLSPILGGHLFENFVLNSLGHQIAQGSTAIHFWRTRDHAEVDFVLNRGSELVPIEVKYTHLARPEIARSMKNFILRYTPTKAYTVHLGKEMQSRVNETTMSFIPYYVPIPYL